MRARLGHGRSSCNGRHVARPAPRTTRLVGSRGRRRTGGTRGRNDLGGPDERTCSGPPTYEVVMAVWDTMRSTDASRRDGEYGRSGGRPTRSSYRDARRRHAPRTASRGVRAEWGEPEGGRRDERISVAGAATRPPTRSPPVVDEDSTCPVNGAHRRGTRRDADECGSTSSSSTKRRCQRRHPPAHRCR